MTASSDVTVAAGGQGNIRLHPYLVTLVRWCVSSLWSTVAILLHRLKTAPLSIKGPSPPAQKVKVLKRAAGTEHLHPEPTVHCQLLHQPEEHTLDVIFVHGLYGSLGNTWRQGDWRPRYQADPKKVTLRNHSDTPCDCRKNTRTNGHTAQHNQNKCNSSDYIYNITDSNDSEMTFTRIHEKLFKKIIPKENDLITEQFYNNTLLDHVDIVDNYENQAKFVRDLFKRENDCDNDCDANDNKNKCKYNEVNECKCSEKQCEVGCGCICDDCYSSCWPKDWIKMDFPGARVISINYTSDPYLWRPLWIKEHKRLSLHTRAEQMMQQLLQMGVGEKPIVWVGHSKGGLFIKEIYCQAYESYKIHNNELATPHEPKKVADHNMNRSNSNNDAVIAETIDNIIGNMFDNRQYKVQSDTHSYSPSDASHHNLNEVYIKQDKVHNDHLNVYIGDKEINDKEYTELSDTLDNLKYATVERISNDITNVNVIDNGCICNDTHRGDLNVYEQNNVEVNSNTSEITNVNVSDNESKCKITEPNGRENEAVFSTIEGIVSRASLFSQSRGFMFYSVPHRGSPLADIKTPVTARSLELLEITKDCELVVSLQSRWLAAAAAARGRGPVVRGFVETCRTLMAVLWLRIVSEDSADAGIGSLHGVSVDHREICKPSSRHCLLYTELVDLIHEALECTC